jgi:hypothetical protein
LGDWLESSLHEVGGKKEVSMTYTQFCKSRISRKRKMFLKDLGSIGSLWVLGDSSRQVRVAFDKKNYLADNYAI